LETTVEEIEQMQVSTKNLAHLGIVAGVLYCKNEYEITENSDILLIVTEWNQFRELDL